jgi:hypothetical protein
MQLHTIGIDLGKTVFADDSEIMNTGGSGACSFQMG